MKSQMGEGAGCAESGGCVLSKTLTTISTAGIWRCAVTCLLVAATAVAARGPAPDGGTGFIADGSAAEPVPAVECDGVRGPAALASTPRAADLPSLRLGGAAQLGFPANPLPVLDVEPLLAEDAATAESGRPLRVGIDRQMESVVAGTWHELPDGGQLWTAAVSSPGATRIRLHFANADLPPGTAIFVYSPEEPDAAVGPYVEAGPQANGDFWAGSVRGDTASIEYRVLDASQATALPFSIDRVGHMYRSLDGDGSAGPRAWDSCMQDVACYFPTWQNISYAVARMVFSDGVGWYNCSGTLIATLNGDSTPYFLTSAHCIDTQSEAQTLECAWFYQRATCGGSFMTTQYSTVADLLATSGAQVQADWTLLMIRGLLPTGVYWSGWTTTNPTDGSWAVTVHHPGGFEKRYSRGKNYSASGYFNNITFNEAGSVGAIYYGTSGSGIWTETDQKLYGNASYTAGEPGCDFPGSSAGYGKFSSYYSTISGYLAAGGDDALESNDTCATATPVAAGSYPGLVVKRYGTSGTQGEDWYRLAVGHGTQLIVTLTFIDAYGNINAQLYNACGGSVVASATGTINNETLTYTNSGATANFYLRVYLVDNPRNTYSMTVQGAFHDCNGNLKDDSCDISCAAPGCASVPGCGQSPDCNGNGIPDECDLAVGPPSGSLDCNNNQVPDECDIASGTSLDCNANGVPDECDLAVGPPSGSLDCNGNQIPDECDIASGYSVDCNANGVPDECEGGDLCPPTALHWVQMPTSISTSAITMEAHAVDPSGVEYYFSATGIGSHSRTWSTAGAYTDSGLNVNRNYSYKVKARDQSAAHTETPYTDAVAVATWIETPTALSFGAITDNSIQVSAPGTFTRLTTYLSGLFFEVTKPDGTPVGGSQANTWVQVQTITATGLTAGQTYRFRVKARNYYGVDETAWYPTAGYVNQATTGGATCALLGDVSGDGLLDGRDVDGFVRAKLGLAPLPGENQACANYGGSLDQDVTAFVADLLGQ
jgi:lysyl endopeptidase